MTSDQPLYNVVVSVLNAFDLTAFLHGMTLATGLQVIMRKLVQVVTPSTNVDDNIGPNTVHLLAIKEVLTSQFSLLLTCSFSV